MKATKGFYSILFHGVFKPDQHKEVRHPFLYVGVDEFESLIRMLLAYGFTFVNEADILEGSLCGSKNILLTFDDGYFNNSYVLPVLERYLIPALFFFVQEQIEEGKLFWWDVYLRQNHGRDEFEGLYEMFQGLKQKRSEVIEAEIMMQYGKESLHEAPEVMRLLSLQEVRRFSVNPLVTIGAHSRSHDNLTLFTRNQLVEELTSCRSIWQSHCSQKVYSISYPFGFYNDEVLGAAEQVGFRLGFTTEIGFNDYFKMLRQPENALRLKRYTFPVPRDCRPVDEQVRWFLTQENLA